MRNSGLRGNSIARQVLKDLGSRLPQGWVMGEPQAAPAPLDALVELSAPDGSTGSIALKTKSKLDPKGVPFLVEDAHTANVQEPLVVVSRYLSRSTRDRLRACDVNYLDLTGNYWLVMPKPGLFIETQGAGQDPDRQERPARSLRGPKAGRIVRMLIDHKQPPGVRELATLAKVNAGYVSRIIKLLDSEALVTRGRAGHIETVDWPALLRRWAEEVPLDVRGEIGTYLEPHGPSHLMERIASSEERYAITGTLAAALYAPVAPVRLAVIWVRDVVEAAGRLALRPVETGANVLFVEPGDENVFEGVVRRNGVSYAAPSQVAADLLTSPGRGPAEADQLITWMLKNEDVWRR